MPLGESMITVLRNNEMLRRVKKTVGHSFYGKKTKEKTRYNLPKGTPELLEQIRLQMKKEQRENTINFLVSIVVALSIYCNCFFAIKRKH